MTLSESTYLLRLLTKRRLAGGIVADLTVDPPSYEVMCRLNPEEPLDLTAFATALWLIGYSCQLDAAGVLTFNASQKLLVSADIDPEIAATVDEPMWDTVPPSDPRWQTPGQSVHFGYGSPGYGPPGGRGY